MAGKRGNLAIVGFIWGIGQICLRQEMRQGVKPRVDQSPRGRRFALTGRSVAAQRHSGGNLILQGLEFPPDRKHDGQRDSNPPLIARPASATDRA